MENSNYEDFTQKTKTLTLRKNSKRLSNFYLEGGIENGMFLILSEHKSKSLKPNSTYTKENSLNGNVIVSINSINVIGYFLKEAKEIIQSTTDYLIIEIVPHVSWIFLREFLKHYSSKIDRQTGLLKEALINIMERTIPMTTKRNLSQLEYKHKYISVPKTLIDELNLQNGLIDLIEDDSNNIYALPIPFFIQNSLSLTEPKICSFNDMNLFNWISLFENDSGLLLKKVTLTLVKENNEIGLGFTVFSAFNGRLLLIRRIFENGAAYVDGCLKSFDRITKVDQFDVIDVASSIYHSNGLTHVEVIDWLRLLPIHQKVELTIERLEIDSKINSSPCLENSIPFRELSSISLSNEDSLIKVPDHKNSSDIATNNFSMDSHTKNYVSLSSRKTQENPLIVIRIMLHARLKSNYGLKFKKISCEQERYFVLKRNDNPFLLKLKYCPKIGDRLHSVNDFIITTQTSKHDLKKIMKMAYDSNQEPIIIRFMYKIENSIDKNICSNIDKLTTVEINQKQYNDSIKSDKIKKILLLKNATVGYGLILKSINRKCIIDGVIKKSYAHINKLVHIGDEIIQINSLPLDRMDYQTAIDLFRQIEPSIELLITCNHMNIIDDRTSASSV